jgi:putative addiction module component (TIGR02574 family)
MMTTSEFDPRAWSIDERLDLIDKLWLSIAVDAERGDERAKEVVDLNRPLEPDVLAELRRRAEALKRDPSSGIRWEQLNEELKKKYG